MRTAPPRTTVKALEPLIIGEEYANIVVRSAHETVKLCHENAPVPGIKRNPPRPRYEHAGGGRPYRLLGLKVGPGVVHTGQGKTPQTPWRVPQI